ncbi:hypothetical protein ABZ330_11785 [Streptomyces sp. NPDC006172]|uniref:hypothetical protein n=1 Tax=Streptomyces sp. NPDC006172 TaxID=3154470 RepID=UPI0033CA861C
MYEKSDRAEEATGDVEGVASGRSLVVVGIRAVRAPRAAAFQAHTDDAPTDTSLSAISAKRSTGLSLRGELDGFRR